MFFMKNYQWTENCWQGKRTIEGWREEIEVFCVSEFSEIDDNWGWCWDGEECVWKV